MIEKIEEKKQLCQKASLDLCQKVRHGTNILYTKIINNYKEKKRNLEIVFIDLEKTYDRLPKDVF